MKSWSHLSVCFQNELYMQGRPPPPPAKTLTGSECELAITEPSRAMVQTQCSQKAAVLLEREDSERIQPVSGEKWGALSVQWAIRYPFTVFPTPRGTVDLTGMVS